MGCEMNVFSRFGQLPVLALATLLCTVGCHKNQDQAVAQDSSSDPAAANLAPVSTDSGAQAPVQYGGQQSAPAPVPYNGQQSPPPPNGGGAYYQASNQAPDYSYNGEQPEYTAPDPPPPLPEYNQPPAPGDDYLWTPGYWAYSQQGYYWVPGVWVQAPYEGALWTPGYWGYWQNHYRFNRGYWGEYIGFYGGIDYGFGYIGYGYQGGYWGGGQFYYNSSVNNVNVSVVHNVYNRSVSGNSGGGGRVSFNGGSGGIQVQARPAELAAMREPHTAPMTAQVQNEHAASTNRAQFASVNKGRPASTTVSQPLAADRNVRAPAALQARNQAAAQQRQAAPQQQQQRQEAHQQQQRPRAVLPR